MIPSGVGSWSYWPQASIPLAVRAEGTSRLYAVAAEPLEEVDRWLDQFRQSWSPRLDALGIELAQGKRARRLSSQSKEGPE